MGGRISREFSSFPVETANFLAIRRILSCSGKLVKIILIKGKLAIGLNVSFNPALVGGGRGCDVGAEVVGGLVSH